MPSAKSVRQPSVPERNHLGALQLLSQTAAGAATSSHQRFAPDDVLIAAITSRPVQRIIRSSAKREILDDDQAPEPDSF
jgi:hypothetical protein